jgi:hypothetical protein
LTGKKPEIADESPSVSTVATSEFYVPQPSAASPMSQSQYESISIWDANELFQ